ncbi:MAG: ExbD/TolR family protein [Akkermansiaceae bacterium]
MSSLSLLLLIGFPLPLKVAAIFLGGFFFLGFKNVEVEKMEAVEEARAAEAAPKELRVRRMTVKPDPDAAQVVKYTVIMVNADGSFKIGADKFNEVQLEKKLKSLLESKPGTGVILKADKQTSNQALENAAKLCKEAGIKNLRVPARALKP